MLVNNLAPVGASNRAIATRYAGRYFRSRTEARYAVLFDALGLDWDYEPEGFELPSGRYLPDFFIRYPASSAKHDRWPGAGYWVEIKGARPSEKELRKMAEVAQATGHKAWLFSGLPNKARAWSDRQTEDGAGMRLAAPILLCSPHSGAAFEAAWRAGLTKATSARFEFGASGE